MKYTMDEVMDVMRRLVRAMDEGQSVGCVDHLDCWDESEVKWYLPRDQAKKILAEWTQATASVTMKAAPDVVEHIEGLTNSPDFTGVEAHG